MSKKKNSKRRKKPRQSSPLAAQRRDGKDLRSPLGAIPQLHTVSWLRDDFPNYLWVCSLLEPDLDDGRRIFIACHDGLNRVLDDLLENKAEDRPVFDGSLTAWEAVPAHVRDSVLASLLAEDMYEIFVPRRFAHVLGMYPSAPGRWLIGSWLERDDFSIDPTIAETTLAGVIRESAHGQSPVATHAKAFYLRGLVLGRKISIARDMVAFDLVPKWPNDLTEEERARVESIMRAMFGASRGAEQASRDDGGGDDLSAIWAQEFWRSNWRLYPCHTARPEWLDGDNDLSQLIPEFESRAHGMWEQFDRVAVQTDPDLFDPDRYEVLTGIVARALRIATSAVHSPPDWTQEHSAPRLRSLYEALILVSWLDYRNDPDLYTRFKEFGRGRLKLQKLHFEEFVDSLEAVPPEIAHQLDVLESLVNQDLDEEFQNIDLRGNFAGIDMRKMADEVGLGLEYRLGFAPSSSDAHGEWTHLDRYALTRCTNPTHRWHRVARQELVHSVDPSVVDALLVIGQRVLDVYCDVIPTSGSRNATTD